MPAEQLAQLFEVLEGGAQVGAGEIIQFPTDVAAAESLAGEGVSTVVELGNGAAAEVSQLTAVEGGAATTTGVGLLAVDVGVAGAAIAPALGILAGVGLYELAPEFWTNVSNKLVEAGQTIAGKVRAFVNGNNKEVGFSEETIEIFKEALMEANAFEQTITEPENGEELKPEGYSDYQLTSPLVYTQGQVLTSSRNWKYEFNPGSNVFAFMSDVNSGGFSLWFCSRFANSSYTYRWLPNGSLSTTNLDKHFVFNGEDIYWNSWYARGQSQQTANLDNMFLHGTVEAGSTTAPDIIKWAMYCLLFGNIHSNTQPGATLPTTDRFPQTYPSWYPWTYPSGVPAPAFPIYPVEIPVNNPDPDQEAAQNPAADPEPAPYLEWLIENLPVPEPNPNPQPVPVPEPDPDPQPEPEPLPDPAEEEVDPDPPDPNPDPTPSPLPVVPDLPATVESNAMFTVYAPSLSQLNSFGGWLWTSSIVEQILRMWQNPLDGIIALMKVYAVPSTGASRNIQVGYLDSGVSAPVVTSQFVTVDCGSVTISETKRNATDYSPYVSLHLYLPFIGIVELDVDEFMEGTISVKYSIDVYTGTCLAEVKCTRSADMPNATILYTFSGNASQQLPLTSANFAGAISSLVSAVGGGLMIASGGGVAGIAGAAAIGHSLTHEMVHVGHSGSLSSNAGIMASRKPYLIISRRHAYDANNYAAEYGYPANKAVYLGNCRGYTRIKAGHLKSKANENEKEEIMDLLKKGVIL